MQRCILLLALLGPTAAVAEPTIPHDAVVLQGLDKVTARVSLLELPLDEPFVFGTLEITPRACLETPPTEPPESAAFLEIETITVDRRGGEAFSGWMFASSPALSALEHPVYDVWVVDCKVTGDPVADAGSSALIDPEDPLKRIPIRRGAIE